MNLEDRILKIEKHNRRLRGAVAAAVVVGCLPWVVGFQTRGPRDVIGNQFQLVDDDGGIRGVWGIKDNVVMLTLIGDADNAHTCPRITLAAAKELSKVLAEDGQFVAKKNGENVFVEPSPDD